MGQGAPPEGEGRRRLVPGPPAAAHRPAPGTGLPPRPEERRRPGRTPAPARGGTPQGERQRRRLAKHPTGRSRSSIPATPGRPRARPPRRGTPPSADPGPPWNNARGPRRSSSPWRRPRRRHARTVGGTLVPGSRAWWTCWWTCDVRGFAGWSRRQTAPGRPPGVAKVAPLRGRTLFSHRPAWTPACLAAGSPLGRQPPKRREARIDP